MEVFCATTAVRVKQFRFGPRFERVRTLSTGSPPEKSTVRFELGSFCNLVLEDLPAQLADPEKGADLRRKGKVMPDRTAA
jgi:hypothetical protein